MNEIFLSYSWKDKQIAEEIFKWLTNSIKQENAVFKDDSSIAAENIRDRIFKSLQKSKIFISLFSDHYFNSKNCCEEWNCVKQYNNENHKKKIQMINIMITPCKLKMRYNSDRIYTLDNEEEILNIINNSLFNKIHKQDIISVFENLQIPIEKKKQFEINVEETSAKYSTLYKSILTSNSIIINENIFQNIGDLLITTDGNIIVKIKGYPGYGKSNFLLILYFYLKKKCERKYIPIYIDLNLYNCYSIEEGKSKLTDDLRQIVKFVNCEALIPIYIIDGFNDYFKKTIEYEAILYSHLKIEKNKTIISTTISDNKYIKNHNSQIFNNIKLHEISIKELDLEDNIANELIENYIRCKNDSTNIKLNKQLFIDELNRLGIKTIDLFSLKLVYQKLFDRLYGDSNDYIDIIKSYIFQYLITNNMSIIKQDESLDNLSRYAYDAFMGDEQNTINSDVYNK